MCKKIGIIDYGSGNTQSIINAFEYLNTKICLIKPNQMDTVDALVLPGVGSFKNIAEKLRPYQKNILEYLEKNKPFLGICVGLQYLFEESFENGKTQGLGFFEGKVKKLPSEKIPQIGWNTLEIKKPNQLLKGLSDGFFVYYVNSYAVDARNCLASSFYKKSFAAVVGQGNVFATQFHPEKSGKNGLKILKNFIKVVKKC